jgi:uncharacterized protein YoxC
MVCKTKKLNKRRYLKRNNSNKYYKKIYGGNNNSQTNPVIAAKESPKMMSNLKATGNLAVSAATDVFANGIKKMGESIGVDPSKSVEENIGEMKENLDKVVETLKSDKGQELLQDFGELGKESVKVLEPALNQVVTETNELIRKQIPIIGDMANKAVLEIPVAGQIAAIAEEGMDVVQALENATESAVKLTTVGTDTLGKLQEQKNKATSLWGKFTGLMGNVTTGVNNGVAGVLNSAQKQVDDYGKSVIKDNLPKLPVEPSSMKQLQQEAKMVGGRAHMSHLEFLAPHVNRSTILKKYGGKRFTKKHQKVTNKRSNRRY